MTAAAPFKRKVFIAAAEAFLADKLAVWRKDYAGSTMEAAAVTYGIQEGWLMPNEGLEAVTILNLFPNADVIQRADYVQRGQITEREAKLQIAAAMQNGLAEANTAIARLYSEGQGPIPATLAADPAVMALVATPLPEAVSATATGIPEAVATTIAVLHRFTICGTELYTLDRTINETVRAAQVQQVNLAVTWQDSPLGRHAVSARLTDAKKESA